MISKVSKDRIYKFSAWLAVAVLALGGFGYGYCVATIQARTARAVEIAINQDAYRAALESKDKLIVALTKSTIVATGQAADAVATAAIATSDAAVDTKAAAVATRAAEDRSQRKPTGSAKSKE